MSDSGIDLVAGGSGFIGSHLCEALLAAGRTVRVVDDLATGYRHNLEGLQLEFVEGDAADPEVAARACEGVAHIYHLAARPSVPWSFEHPEAAYHANHQTTLSLIEAGAAAGARRIVFSSSSAIYGDGPELPKRESLPPAPQSPYAEHKLAGERALHEAHAAGRIEAVSLRYFNVYGPRQDPTSPYSGVISLFAKWVREGTRPTIFAGALAKGNAYDQTIRDLKSQGADTETSIFTITTTDVRDAADIFRPVYDATGGVDGRVSIEVSPELAHDTEATIAQAKEL